LSECSIFFAFIGKSWIRTDLDWRPFRDGFFGMGVLLVGGELTSGGRLTTDAASIPGLSLLGLWALVSEP
jgi:hypothetical protein